MISSPCPKCLKLYVHNPNECTENKGISPKYILNEMTEFVPNINGTFPHINLSSEPPVSETALLHYQKKHLSPYYIFDFENAGHPYPFDIKLIIYDTLNEPEKSKAEFKDYLNVLCKKYGYEKGMDEKALSQIECDGAFHSVFHPDDYSNRLSIIAVPNEVSEPMMRANLIHECLHSAIRIFHDVDVPINGNYSEAFCYFTERLITNAMDAVERLKEL